MIGSKAAREVVTYSDVDLVLPSTGSITGRVVTTGGSTLAGYSSVELSTQFGRQFAAFGADGTFSFPEVTAGTFLLKAMDRPGASFAFNEGVLAASGSEWVELVLNGTPLPKELRDGNGASYNALRQLEVGDGSQFGPRQYVSNVAVAPGGYTQPAEWGAELRLGGRELRIGSNPKSNRSEFHIYL